MTDLRQGVTPTQHAVLDLIEQRAEEWQDAFDFDDKLIRAISAARQAQITSRLTTKRQFAIEAAARLIDVADEISRLMESTPA